MENNNIGVSEPHRMPTHWHGVVDKNGKPDPTQTGSCGSGRPPQFLKCPNAVTSRRFSHCHCISHQCNKNKGDY